MKRVLIVILVLLPFILSACSKDAGPTGEVVRTAPSCTDTDGGVLVRAKGTVSGILESAEAYEKEDFCYTDIVVEYYCENNMPVNRNHRCTTGCKEGACINPLEG